MAHRTRSHRGSQDPSQLELEEPVSGINRRVFLTRSSMTVVAAGVASAMPALPGVISDGEAAAPEAESFVADGEALDGPLIAHVKSLSSGEMSLYSGEREINIIDRGLAAKLFNASK
jgi:hypothetical protein